MRRMGVWSVVVSAMSAAFLCLACDSGQSKRPPVVHGAHSAGGAVVMSRDERVAVVANRSAGVLSVCRLDAGARRENSVDAPIVSCTGLDWGAGSEPWAAVIGADDDTAYVISRRDQTVTRVSTLKGEPQVTGTVSVGAEPTSIVISPSGARLFIANWAEGTISVVSTFDFALRGSIDLNPALLSTEVLGDVSPRLGLAHPRALTITDDGDLDDADETLYATEFFSQPLPSSSVDFDPDRNRQGFVYPIRLADDGAVGTPIALAAVEHTGFSDSNPSTSGAAHATGCFPNQLYAAAVHDTRLFVTSMCTSPAGPTGSVARDGGLPDSSNFQTLMHPALFVVDTTTNTQLVEQTAILTRSLADAYVADGTDAAAIRMPLIPNSIAFSADEGADSAEGCITALGADALFCFRYDASGLVDIGQPNARFSGLDTERGGAGHNPIGLALSRAAQNPFALVLGDTSQTLSFIPRDATSPPSIVATTADVARTAALSGSDEFVGKELFATGLDVWSFGGQAWTSCESCHPDGLSDGVTWFFPRGPRRTLSTAPSYDSAGQRRVMLWTASIDEVHDVEAIVRNIAGGTGAMLWSYTDPPSNNFRIVYDGVKVPDAPPPTAKPSSVLRNNLNGSLAALLEGPSCRVDASTCDGSSVTDWGQIDAYVRAVRTPRAPAIEGGPLARGAALFEQGRCAACHGGPGWTRSTLFYTPGNENNGTLPFDKPSDLDTSFLGRLNDEDATLLGRLRSTRYRVDASFSHLNPPASADGGASVRRWAPGASALDFAYDPETHQNDQINCLLRDVGTFPAQGRDAVNTVGITASGAPPVREFRQNMTALAIGASGFSPPSLLGLFVGAPYFHAGNARTLEEVFDPAFEAHHQALAPDFLAQDAPTRGDDVRALVSFLLAIDDYSTTYAGEPALDFCAAIESPFK